MSCLVSAHHVISLLTLSCLGGKQQPPPGLTNGSAPWLIASGVLYPEDITDDSPFLFTELPGRMTGSYSGYNVDPLFVTVLPPQMITTATTALLMCRAHVSGSGDPWR
jgi:hypothetical protein